MAWLQKTHILCKFHSSFFFVFFVFQPNSNISTDYKAWLLFVYGVHLFIANTVWYTNEAKFKTMMLTERSSYINFQKLIYLK